MLGTKPTKRRHAENIAAHTDSDADERRPNVFKTKADTFLDSQRSILHRASLLLSSHPRQRVNTAHREGASPSN